MLLTNAIRLIALFAFAWVAWRDYQTQRVPGSIWRPLALLGVALIAVDVATGHIAVAVNALVGFAFMVGISRLLAQLGTWGGADTQAFAVVALLFPVAPLGTATLTPFAVAVFVNSMLLAGAYILVETGARRRVPESIPFLVPAFGGLLLAVAVGGPFALLF